MGQVDVQGTFKGYSTAHTPENTPVDTLVAAINMFVYNGEVVQREPFKITVNQQDAHRCMGAYSYVIEDGVHSENWIVFRRNTGGSGVEHRIVSGPTTWADAQALTTTYGFSTITSDPEDVVTRFALWNNVLYFACKGSYHNFKYIKNTSGEGLPHIFEPQGIPVTPQITSIGLASVGGDPKFPATGTYRYFTTYGFNKGGQSLEGNPGPDKQTVNLISTNQHIVLTIHELEGDDLDAWINEVHIYRADATTGQSTYYHVGTTAITSSDPVVWTDVGGTNGDFYGQNRSRELPVDNTQLTETISDVVIYAERMWFMNTNNHSLHYSKAGAPEYVPGINLITVGEDNDIFKKLIPMPEYLLIIKQNSIWILEGKTPQDFRLMQVGKGYGSHAANMAFMSGGFLYTAGPDGIFRSTLHDSPVDLTRQIELDWTDVIKTNYDQWQWAIDPHTNFIWFLVDYDSVNDWLEKIFIFDPISGMMVGKIEGNFSHITNVSLGTPGAALQVGVHNGTYFQFAYYGDFPADLYVSFVTETSMNVSFQTGRLSIPYSQKTYQYFKMGLQSEIPSTSTVDIKGVLDTSLVTLKSGVTLVASQNELGNIGRSGHHLSLGLAKANLNANTGLRVRAIRLVWEAADVW